MPLPHSVSKQSVHNVSAHQLQQHMIQVWRKMITVALLMNLWSKSFCIIEKMVFQLVVMLASFSVCFW